MVLIIQGGGFFETCFHLKKVVETLLVYGSTSKPRLALSVEELSRTTMIPLHTLCKRLFFIFFLEISFAVNNRVLFCLLCVQSDHGRTPDSTHYLGGEVQPQ